MRKFFFTAQEHLKEGGKMVDFAGRWTRAKKSMSSHVSSRAWDTGVSADNGRLLVASRCSTIALECVGAAAIPGYAMPVQYEAKGSKHALSIIDSTKWTRCFGSDTDRSKRSKCILSTFSIAGALWIILAPSTSNYIT